MYMHVFTKQCHSQTTPSSEQETFLAPSTDKQPPQI